MSAVYVCEVCVGGAYVCGVLLCVCSLCVCLLCVGGVNGVCGV